MIKIVPPKPETDNGLATGDGTKIFDDKGNDLSNAVSRCVVVLAPGEIVHAIVEMAVTPETILAQPLLGLDTVRAAAAEHGYDLVRKVRGAGAQELLDAVLKFADENLPPEPAELTPLERHARRKL